MFGLDGLRGLREIAWRRLFRGDRERVDIKGSTPSEPRSDDVSLGATPFYERYPYPGRHALRRIDRNTVVDLDAGYLLHRIPKVANSVLAASVAQYATGRRVTHHSHDAMKAMRDDFRHPSSLTAEELDAVDGLFKFVFARDPYNRLLSAYLSKVRPFETDRRRRDADWAKAPDWTSSPSFETFCRYLADGGLYYNAHWVPQVDFLLFPVERYDFVGRVETLADDFSAVCERLFPGRGPFELVGEDSRHATGSKARMDEFYTPELYRLVGALYARDFEAFGYPRRG